MILLPLRTIVTIERRKTGIQYCIRKTWTWQKKSVFNCLNPVLPFVINMQALK